MFHKSPPTPEVHLRPLRPALGAGGGAAAAGHGGHRAAGLLPLLQVRSGHENLELRRGLRGLAPGPPLLGAGECEGGARGADHQHVDGSGPGDVTVEHLQLMHAFSINCEDKNSDPPLYYSIGGRKQWRDEVFAGLSHRGIF